MSDKINIDGKEYSMDDLSEDAKIQLNNLGIVDAQIQTLQQKVAVAQTARLAYVAALKEALPK